ncbi:MAG: phosphoenolpyruvate synthase/pyruvate phosphate dikinase [Marivirga sp.]
MAKLDREHFSNLEEVSSTIKSLILKGEIPDLLVQAITQAYQALGAADGSTPAGAKK